MHISNILTTYLSIHQLGKFLNTMKRILDVLHCKVEDILKSWASYLPVMGDNKKAQFGEQMNGITVLLRTKYKTYLQATVGKLISNVSAQNSFLVLLLKYSKVNILDTPQHCFSCKLTVIQGSKGF